LPEKSNNYSDSGYYSHYPLRSAAYLVVRIAGREIKRAASIYFKGKLIDIGCGGKWKEDLIGRYVDEYTGLDHEHTPHDKSKIDLLGTVYHIPTADESYDSAVCTAVLEHVEEPSQAIAECRRVLKKGGYAIYTAPLFWHLHEEPRDFYRYTRYGLTHLFEKNRFKIVEIKPLAGFWVTASANWAYYLQRFRKRRWFHPLRWLVTPLTVCSHCVAGLMNKFDRSRQFTWMYLVVAQK
jgi:SAM-dependent methyltransferase